MIHLEVSTISLETSVFSFINQDILWRYTINKYNNNGIMTIINLSTMQIYHSYLLSIIHIFYRFYFFFLRYLIFPLENLKKNYNNKMDKLTMNFIALRKLNK